MEVRVLSAALFFVPCILARLLDGKWRRPTPTFPMLHEASVLGEDATLLVDPAKIDQESIRFSKGLAVSFAAIEESMSHTVVAN